MKVLIICTSNDKMGTSDKPTGSWAEEIMSPYLAFKEAGLEVTIASMKGGAIPIDAGSLGDSFRTEEVDQFYADTSAVAELENSVALSDITGSDYQAVFLPGGHGVCWDMTEDKALQSLIASMYESGAVVSSVCHGPAALANVQLSDNSYLIEGKNVTGFSNTEEAAVGLTEVVPFLLESQLEKNGSVYSKLDDWHPYAVRDRMLITGQNPQSSKEVARLVIEALKESE